MQTIERSCYRFSSSSPCSRLFCELKCILGQCNATNSCCIACLQIYFCIFIRFRNRKEKQCGLILFIYIILLIFFLLLIYVLCYHLIQPFFSGEFFLICFMYKYTIRICELYARVCSH